MNEVPYQNRSEKPLPFPCVIVSPKKCFSFVFCKDMTRSTCTSSTLPAITEKITVCTLKNNARYLGQVNALLHIILPWRISTRYLKEMLVVSFNTKGCIATKVFKWLNDHKTPHTAERIESSQDSLWADTQHQLFSQLTKQEQEAAATEISSGVIWCSQPHHQLQLLPSAPRDQDCCVVHSLKRHCQALLTSSKSLHFTCGQEQ